MAMPWLIGYAWLMHFGAVIVIVFVIVFVFVFVIVFVIVSSRTS